MSHNLIATLLLVVFAILCFIAPYSFFLIIPLLIFWPKPTNKRTRDYTPPEEPEALKLFIFRQNKRAYLQTIFWHTTRKQIYIRDRYTCQSCGITNVPLHVHHLRDYDKLGYESLDSLTSVCEDCHTYQHLIYGYPQTYDDYMNWNVQLIKRTRNVRNL
jgi:hypothetical protein